MGEVVDVRPDRFLRAMRETGDWNKSCEQSGLTSEEANALCSSNPKYDLAAVECQLEFVEDYLLNASEEVIKNTRALRDQRIREIRTRAMSDYHSRHETVGAE